MRAVAPAIAAALLVWAILAGVRGFEDRRAAARIEEALRAAPGYAVFQVTRQDDVRVVRGLRDPDSAVPAEVAAAGDGSFEPREWRFELGPWTAPAAEFMVARMERMLGPPAGVRLELVPGPEATTVAVSGEAEHAWVAALPRRFAALQGAAGPGVHLELDAAALVDRDGRRLADQVERLEVHALVFDVGRDEVSVEEIRNTAAVSAVRELGLRAVRADRLVRISLRPVRHSAESASQELALRRIEAARDALAAVAGSHVLFEPRLVVDSELPVGDSGAVMIPAEVLGAAPAGSAAAPAAQSDR